MDSFDQALEWASQGDESKTALLLGNGFSMAYDSTRFSYGALATLAQDRQLLPESAIRIMAASGSNDFEALMRQLQSTISTLISLDATAHDLTIRALEQAVVAVREALARSVAGLHPDRPFEIEESSYRRVRAFLDRFRTIYTVSYDLLLYWSLMQTFGGVTRTSDDGFRDSGVEGDDTVLWNVYDPYAQSVHYLHGALHLYRGADGLRKITYIRTQEALIDQVRHQLEVGRYPLYVAEGESSEKLARIGSSGYLSRSLRSLTGRGNGMVVYGHSLDQNDDHIFEAIIRSKVRRIAISVYGDEASAPNQVIQKRAVDLAERRRLKHSAAPLEVQFFDASSVQLW